ncbi:GNAT family N-acetyltransferase [Sanguibacter sp. Leaf3]|uniref:GNAT family N-acetyltransferase n=1 Tax=Sanguibacter sp. Leaf3 TaxID=1736209 RepID=UPI0006F84472|nr:GNAT family N-acetyltransferase [Sanguibacter sp. Leaf3]KQT98381.1 hypothetical protein ASG53_12025 [Sanguibacter sp. Leaf3]
MNIRLVPTLTVGKLLYPAFDDDDRFDFDDWQDECGPPSGEQWFEMTHLNRAVARARLQPADESGYEYGLRQPHMHAWIVTMEVATDARCAGHGRRMMEHLARTSDRPLHAYSIADGFWEALGWTRHVHRTKPGSSALYVTP